MNDFPLNDFLLFILGLLCGFASAIWLAVALNDDAKKISEHEQGSDEPAQRS